MSKNTITMTFPAQLLHMADVTDDRSHMYDLGGIRLWQVKDTPLAAATNGYCAIVATWPSSTLESEMYIGASLANLASRIAPCGNIELQTCEHTTSMMVGPTTVSLTRDKACKFPDVLGLPQAWPILSNPDSVSVRLKARRLAELTATIAKMVDADADICLTVSQESRTAIVLTVDDDGRKIAAALMPTDNNQPKPLWDPTKIQ